VGSALVVALIAGAVAIASAAIAAWAQMRVKKLERLAHQEETRSQARIVLDRYRGPLLDAAWDLGDRLDNITDRRFLETYGAGDRRPMAIQTTLSIVAQYFGWAEIVRREVQLLRFESTSDTQRAAYYLSLVMRRFATDWYDSAEAQRQATHWIPGFDAARLPHNHLMLWHEGRRGLGDRMIVPNESPRCKGFATFLDDFDQDFHSPLAEFETGLCNPDVAKSLRLLEIRDALARLVIQLDDEKRYGAAESGHETWLARARRSPCWTAYDTPLESEQ
jgi:hypothetical protein